MRAKPTTELLVMTRKLWEQAAFIGRIAQKKVIEDAATQCNLSYSAMTRHLALNARRRSYGEAEEARIEEVNEYARKVYDFQQACERDGRKMTTEVAYNALLKTGQIPDIGKKRVYAAIERLSLKNESMSVARKFRGQKKPLGMMQVDYSKSTVFMFDPTGRVYYHPQLSKQGSRLWIAAGVDDYSRVVFFRYYITDGENSGFVRDALIDIFEEKERVDPLTGEYERMKMLCGIPGSIYFDRGSGNDNLETKTGLGKLGVTGIYGMNEKDSVGRMTNRSNKKARGKIERKFRHFKDTFENELVGLHKLGAFPPQITLAWLNDEAAKFAERINSEKHPVLEGTKWDLFATVLSEIEYPPEEARSYFTRSLMVRVYGRLIHIGKELAFKAPKFIDDGDEIEILKSGKNYFMWHSGKRVQLEAQDSQDVVLEEKKKERDGYFEGLYLKEMMVEEIDKMSGGELTLKSLPASLDDDKKEFFEQPRSREDIRMKAQYFVDEARREKGKYKIINYKEIVK